ncbi:MAG TPA: FAD-dependent oxidoreductase, partial [Chloroflexota bacterium]|nr:FAD-dependent oxidoreductase [Chloroflexota bacterium]
MSAPWNAEVIVVGGGPAGSATAALLAQRGRDVLLLDRARFPRYKACAEYVSPASVDVLERLGALRAVEQHQPVRPLGMTLIQDGRAQALIRYPGIGLSGLPAETVPAGEAVARRALCLSREVLD